MVLTIFKMIATVGFPTALECTKFARTLTDPLAGLRALLLREKKGEEEGKETEKEIGRGRGTGPLS